MNNYFAGCDFMVKINFNFDYKKAAQALNYFARKSGGQIEKLKALKLIYLADRYHLRKYGRLITNDIYFAMKLGPVASSTKDIVENSEFLDDVEKEYALQYLKLMSPYVLASEKDVDSNVFSDSDLEALDFAWEKFGHIDKFMLANLTHKYPEWKRNEASLSLNPRIEMRLLDFLDDPDEDIEKCFTLTDQDRENIKEQIEETYYLNSLWR